MSEQPHIKIFATPCPKCVEKGDKIVGGTCNKNCKHCGGSGTVWISDFMSDKIYFVEKRIK